MKKKFLLLQINELGEYCRHSQHETIKDAQKEMRLEYQKEKEEIVENNKSSFYNVEFLYDTIHDSGAFIQLMDSTEWYKWLIIELED